MSYRQFIRLTVDRILAPLHKSATIQKLDKILLCNIAHLGDAVIASSVIRPLKEALPNAKIGFLCSNYSACVFKDHPDLDWLHTLEHRRINRSQTSYLKKVATYYRTKTKAASEIKSIGYDIAIDLYPFFPNAAPLLWQTGIPVRIGYVKGGFAPLFTHPIPWDENGRYCLSYHYDLLDHLPVKISRTPIHYRLPNPTNLSLPEKFLLFNTGTGGWQKEWSEESWRQLTQTTKELPIVFTGKGRREKERIKRITQGLSHTVDLCDQLSWNDLCFVITKAQQVVTVDSVVSHLAEAYQIPLTLLIVDPISTPMWTPPHATALFRPIPQKVYSEIQEKIHSLQKEPFSYSFAHNERT